jgi:hypothetical protein
MRAPPFGARRVRIHEYGNGAGSRNQFAKQFHALRLQGGGKETHACQVATWSIEARNEAKLDRVISH